MTAASSERRTLHYAGHVQGVGFRYSTVSVAQGFAVTGFVQNLPDGRVLVVAEGAKPELTAFAQALGERMERYIQHVTSDTTAPTGEFHRFEIRH
jgi:acylphosphatase